MTFLLHILDKLFSQGYKKGDVSDILTFSLRGSLPKFIIYASCLTHGCPLVLQGFQSFN